MEISTVSISSLVLIILFLLLLLIIEIKLHLNSLSKIPIRIHVNGARGKSSVVRLIAAGLRSGGFKTFAKTTGTIPRIINEKGEDVELHRLRSASIGEQIKLIRYFPNPVLAVNATNGSFSYCRKKGTSYGFLNAHIQQQYV